MKSSFCPVGTIGSVRVGPLADNCPYRCRLPDRNCHQEVAEQVVLLRDHAVVVPAQAVVDSDPRGYTEAILQIETVAIFEGVAARVARVLEAATNGSLQKIRSAPRPSPLELQPPAEVFVEVLRNAGAAELEPRLQVVLSNFP